MRNVTASAVAKKLVDQFSRYGITREILTDQGTNFTLLQELHRLTSVKAIRTSPYHPQSDGLVEHLTKQMLRKSLLTERRQWDKLLPLVLFAYKEVPQETTGFSPLSSLLQGMYKVLWTP